MAISSSPAKKARDPVSKLLLIKRNGIDGTMTESKLLNILVADDTELNRTMVTRLLQRNGHNAISVNDGLQAFDRFRQETFDAVLMDVQMPVMDGIDATKNIRQWEKAESKIPVPIIALTANDEKRQRDLYLSAGMNDVIVKPIDVKTLLPAIEKIISAGNGEAG
jgi:CheY-like chemotaxis protein